MRGKLLKIKYDHGAHCMRKHPMAITVIITFLISLPSLSIHSAFPFVIITVFYMAVSFLAQKRTNFDWLPVYRGLIFIALFFIPVSCGVWLSEQSTAIGPLHAHTFEGDVGALIQSDSIPYRSGQLVSFYRTEKNAPVLAYIVGKEVRWASELDQSETDIEIDGFVAMQIRGGILRDRVDFFAAGHGEPGWAYMWKIGSVQKFYVLAF